MCSARGGCTWPDFVFLLIRRPPRTSSSYLPRRPASRSARSKSWSPVFHRSHRFRRSCASSRTAAIPRPSHRHSRSATPSRWRRPSRRLLLRWYRKARPRRDERRAVVAPLAEDTFKFQFTASRACRDKFRQAQDLLRHRIPDGDLAMIFEKALDLLIEQVKKERSAAGRKARHTTAEESDPARSRHIPDAIKREVFERDGGRCIFTDEHGRKCGETGALEFDHRDGFARTHLHRAAGIRLLCRAHNQHAAEQMYGRAFMERARAPVDRTAAGPEIPSG